MKYSKMTLPGVLCVCSGFAQSSTGIVKGTVRFASVRSRRLDASPFNTVAITERVNVRSNADFFNLLNPEKPSGIGGRLLSTFPSEQAARELQLTPRLTW
jgi:hypothetical protein